MCLSPKLWLRRPGVAFWVCLLTVASAFAQPPSPASVIPNGTWTVQGREIPGTRCGHWGAAAAADIA